MNPKNIMAFDKDSYVVTGYTKKGRVLKGALVKEAFVYKDNMYYVDKYGDKVVNHALQVGTADIIIKDDEKNVTGIEGFQTNDNQTYKTFILFNSKGEAYEDVAIGRTVKVGSKKYIAVDEYEVTLENDSNKKVKVTLFVYDNIN